MKFCKKEPLNKNYIGFSVNTTDEYIEVYGLIREKNIKFYLPISRAKIPFDKESVEEVEEFIHALLTLRVSMFYSYKVNLSNQIQKRSRKNSKSPSYKGERLNKKKSMNF